MSLNYQKVWDWTYNRYYYINLRFEDAPSQWTRPPVVSKHTEDVILTPRSFFEVHHTDRCADLEFLTSERREAKKVQETRDKAKRRLEARKEDKRVQKLLAGKTSYKERSEALKKKKRKNEEARGVILAEDDDIVTLEESEQLGSSDDEEQALEREREREQEQEQEELALVAVGAGAAGIVGLRRKNTRKIEEQKKAAKVRVLQLNVRASALRAQEERLLKGGGTSREDASKKLQSGCRVWMARRDLAKLAFGMWHCVRPEASRLQAKAGKRAKPYFINMRTNEAHWNKPKSFGSQDVKEISTVEYGRRQKKWLLRGNRPIVNMNLCYPKSEAHREGLAATIIQSKLVRMNLSRQIARYARDNIWIEEIDEESGESFWRDSRNGTTKWDEPWTPRDSLARMRQEKKTAAKKRREERRSRKTNYEL